MSGPRLGRFDVRAEFARRASAARREAPPSTNGTPHFTPRRPDPIPLALAPRPPSPDFDGVPTTPRERLAALATAAQQVAAELEWMPRALDEIARRVRKRITPAQCPDDDALVEDLHRLQERAFLLSLDVWRLAREAGMPEPDQDDGRRTT